MRGLIHPYAVLSVMRGALPLSLLVCLASVWLLAVPAVAQGPRIEDIRWEGLRRIPRDTMNARIISKKGDRYNPNVLRRDFRAVWNTNFFETVRLEVDDGEDNSTDKILYFIVQERPLIRRIDYDGVKSLQQSDILEGFRLSRVGLSVEMQYDPTRVRRAEVVLTQMLAQRGRMFAKVAHVTRRVPPNAVVLIFVVEEGPKVKVGEISFEGNRRFSDRTLVRTMKNSRPMGIPPFLYFMSKTYNGNKVQEDLERLRELYQEQGYFRAVIHQPETRNRDTKPFFPLRLTMPFFFKPGKAVNLRIRIDEGTRYRMGKLEVRSSTGEEKDLFFTPEFLKNTFPLKQSDIFDVTLIRKALENYGKLYSEFGFINATVVPETDIDDQARVIDITLDFEPNKQFFVHRIEFLGNTKTRDTVIRRELLLDEGMMFNSRLWELSILRLNQLNFFERLDPENADVQQNAQNNTVDLALKVKEKGKNSIGFTGGSSGVLGSFLGLNYTTNNFLGLGETLSVDTQWGDRQRVFRIGFTEPYLFDKSIQSGFTVFLNRFKFDQAQQNAIITGSALNISDALQSRLVNYNQNSVGFTAFASYPLRKFRFMRVGLTYSFSTSDITCISEGCTNLFEGLAFRQTLAGPNSLEGIQSSRITGTYFYNTVNHPIFPTGGTSFFISNTLEGGVLGGNQKTYRPTIEFRHFRPVNRRRNTLAFRVIGAFVTGYGGQVPSPFSRFYVGGEDTIRGFNIRAVSPLALAPARSTIPIFFFDPTRLDANGNPTLQSGAVELLSQSISFPGGDTQVITNSEYRIPLAGPLTLSLFLDAGISTILRRGQLRLTDQRLAELNTLFPTADLSENLTLVPGTNGKVRVSTGVEIVINLPIVQAPFRLYWAYNLSRLNTTIVQPAGIIRTIEGFPLPPGVLEQQLLSQPQLLFLTSERSFFFNEPLKTFRFTISRTF